jgi:hypothetical protein
MNHSRTFGDVIKAAALWLLQRGVWATWRIEETEEGPRHRFQVGINALADDPDMIPFLMIRNRRFDDPGDEDPFQRF